jgi:hypothetical protein
VSFIVVILSETKKPSTKPVSKTPIYYIKPGGSGQLSRVFTIQIPVLRQKMDNPCPARKIPRNSPATLPYIPYDRDPALFLFLCAPDRRPY